MALDPTKVKYMTMASWMRGYASGLDEKQYETLIFKLQQASELLDAVWNEYARENGLNEPDYD